MKVYSLKYHYHDYNKLYGVTLLNMGTLQTSFTANNFK